MKAVAWESKKEKVYLTFNSAEYLAERHHLAGEPFKAVEALLVHAVILADDSSIPCSDSRFSGGDEI